MMTEEPGPAPEDEDVQAAAEHAERAVQERREMAPKASQAEAADGDVESSELERESEQHGDASHDRSWRRSPVRQGAEVHQQLAEATA